MQGRELFTQLYLRVKKRLKGLAKVITDLAFPPVCVICGNYCDHDICGECLKLIFRSSKGKMELPGLYSYGSLYFYARYSGPVKELIGRYKFRGEMWLGRRIGSILFEFFREELRDYDCIVYVPVSRTSFRKRGFDQCHEIAYEVSKRTGIGIMEIIESNSRSPKQSRLKRDLRRDNVSGRFRLKEGLSARDRERLRGSRILLIDDILTTGSTLRECASILVDTCGSSAVDAMVFATGRTDIG
ncbi:MAG: ComF family protein [Clostridia bacterium]|nr:ComF family protein [Clostridia bacterium]